MYFAEHLSRSQAIEFAFLLEKIPGQHAQEQPRKFVEAWCEKVMGDAAIHPLRMLRFEEAMTRDSVDRQIATLPSLMLMARWKAEGRTNCEDQLAQLKHELDADRAHEKKVRERGVTLLGSLSWRIARLLGKVLSLVRG